MSDMPLEEARRIALHWTDTRGVALGELADALRVILAALPKEHKTPGQVFVEATGAVWSDISDGSKETAEAGAAAVLREFAVQPEDVTPDDVNKLREALLDSDGYVQVEAALKDAIRRIQERKGQ